MLNIVELCGCIRDCEFVMILSFIVMILVVILIIDSGFWLAFLIGLGLPNHVKYYFLAWVY